MLSLAAYLATKTAIKAGIKTTKLATRIATKPVRMTAKGSMKVIPFFKGLVGKKKDKK